MRTTLCLLLVSAAAIAGNEIVPEITPEITAEELKGHIRILASDEFEGRRPGTKGGDLAAAYIAERFAEIGLFPIGDDDTWYQEFDLPVRRPDPRLCTLTLKQGEKTELLAVAADWTAFPSSDDAEVADAEVVFAGYGLTAPKLSYDDYAGLDVKGKIVLILRHGPRWGTDSAMFAGRNQGYITFAAKARFAMQAGAAAVILVNDSVHMKDDPLAVPMMSRGTPRKVPYLFAKKSVAERLFKASGEDFEGIQKEIDRTGKPRSLPLSGSRLSLKLVQRPIRSANVVGYLKGSDEKLNSEVIVVGGHYDHLGTDGMGGLDRGGEDRIWNGADDNASGTTGVIELAEHFALAAEKPRRSFLFIAFTGEEMGLLGSRHYVTKPILPLERTITMVNLDMVGRLTNGRLHIGGVGTSPVFDGFITKAADGLGLDILRGRGGAAPSDNSPFFQKGMPTLFFFTGIHKDYHRATDHWDTLNYAGFAKTLTVATRIIRSIDALPERPPFVNARTAFLGVQFARGGKGEGAGIARVVPNSPAVKAGMKDGDRVISFAGQPIANTADLSKAIRDRIGGEEVEVKVRRGEETVALRVKLGAR